MCGRHSSECNLQDVLVLFPQHRLRLPGAVRENDRTRAAREIKPNHNENINFLLLTRVIFASVAREQHANKGKFNISELWNRSAWKKQIIYITVLTHPPPPPRNFWTLDPPPPNPSGISNPFRGGGMDIFWNHTIYDKGQNISFCLIT